MPRPRVDLQFGRYVGIFDSEHHWVAANDDLAALLGYRVRELVGRSAIPMSPREQRAPVRESLLRDGVFNGIGTPITRDGTLLRMRYSARIVNGGEFLVAAGELLPPPPPPPELAPELLHPERPPRNGFTLAHELAIDGWLTKHEAAEYARVSIATVDRAVHDGKLHAGGTPGLRLFRRAWLDAWLGAAIAVVAALLTLVGLYVLGVVRVRANAAIPHREIRLAVPAIADVDDEQTGCAWFCVELDAVGAD